MKFYAYIPDSDGKEPFGTDNRMLFELKTQEGAMRHAIRYFGPTVRLFTYTDIFDDSTFNEVVIHVHKIKK